MEPDGSSKIITLNFMALFGAVFFLFVALDFYIPVLPFYVIDVGGNEAAVGLLMGLFTFCSVILRPFQGRAINHRGRKRLLVSGILLYFSAGLGLMLLPSIPMLFIVRAIQGFGWGAFLLAFNTMTLDLAPPGRSGEALGLMGIAPPFSLAAAPLIGEYCRIASGGNYLFLFLFSSLAGLAALLFALRVREPEMEKSLEEKKPLLSRKVLFPSIIIFCMTFNLGAILTFLPLLGEARNIDMVGYFFTVFALTTVISRPAAGRLSDHLGRSTIFIPALLVAAGSMVIIAFSFTRQQFLISAFLLGVGFGSAHSSVMALAADRLQVMERGIGMATFTAAFDLGIVAGSVTLGLLLGWFSFQALFILCAIIMILPVLLNIIKQQLQEKAGEN